ncbi:hypothetical protein H5410_017237, partial [Solanum commersonii]
EIGEECDHHHIRALLFISVNFQILFRNSNFFFFFLSVYCMAANLQSRGLVSLGKRVVNQISYASARTTANSPSLSGSDRATIRKYWAPHPQTGVFGPVATDTAGAERNFYTSPATAATAESILEQKTFFRPLEDLEKPMLN